MPAAAKVETKVVLESQGFAGGVNIRDAITLLGPDECRRLENGVLDERGGFSKRLGMLSKGSFGSSGHRVLSSYVFYRVGQVPQLIIHTTGGQVLYTNDPEADPIVWTQMVTGMSTTAPFSYETFNSKVYMGNGVNDYASWDGTTRTAFPSAPKGRYLRAWKDTMWVSGIPGAPDRVYSSSPGDPETYPISTWVDLTKGDGDEVVALATDGTFLIIGKRNRAMSIHDPVTFSNRVVDFEKGFESHFAVAQFEGVIYYVSRRGICQWLGDTPSRIISGKVDPFFDPTIIDLGALSRCWAYTYENRIGWVFVEMGSDIPSVQLEYYPRLLSRNSNVGPFAFQRMPMANGVRWRYQDKDRLFVSHNVQNKVLQAFAPVGTDDGVIFSSLAETGAIDFDQPTVYKYLRRMRMIGRGQFTLVMMRNFSTTIYKNFNVDMTSGADLWTTAEPFTVSNPWGSSRVVREFRLHPDAYVRFLVLQFSDSDPDTGTKPIPVGSKDYRLIGGEWAIYGHNIDAIVLGVRD